jgi:hypothetical protein
MKKQLVVLGAAAIIAAAAVPALAFENEFHGMYRFLGYESNFFNGFGGNLQKDAHSGWSAEQRARIQYIAKANDDLKLVTQFELDARFGGVPGGYKGTTGNDSGNLDADQLTLETKNVYVDFNCPITGTNVKVGIQPWADSYQSLFLLADASGIIAKKGFGPVTASLGWFRLADNTAKTTAEPGQMAADMIVVDGKFALSKDITLGASYYNIQNDTGPALTSFELLHMIGVNADIKVGPATIKPFAAYQFGDYKPKTDISAYGLGVTGNVKVAAAGKVNFAAVYLSGDKNTATGDAEGWLNVSDTTTYFNAANMWLILPSGQGISSLTSVVGRDINNGDRGLMGLFVGFDGTAGKVFYNANLGYTQTAEERGSEDGTIGTEINAQVGYKLYDNLSVSAAAAYAILGDGMNSTNAATRLPNGRSDADDPWALITQVSYTF